FIYVERRDLRGALLDQRTDSANDLAGSIAFLHDPSDSRPRLVQIRRCTCEPSETGIGVSHDGGQGLVYLVGNRPGKLTHGGHASHVSQLGLRRLYRLLRQLPLRNIHNGAHKLQGAGSVRKRAADTVDVLDGTILERDPGLKFM